MDNEKIISYGQFFQKVLTSDDPKIQAIEKTGGWVSLLVYAGVALDMIEATSYACWFTEFCGVVDSAPRF